MNVERAWVRGSLYVLLSADDPLYAVIKQWCAESNRKSFVHWRVALLVLSVAGAMFVPPLWSWLLLMAAIALGVSLVCCPPQSLFRYLVERQFECVPDRLLLLIAESTAIDLDVKVEMARVATQLSALTYSDLIQIAERNAQARARTQRCDGVGFRALTSLVGFEATASASR